MKEEVFLKFSNCKTKKTLGLDKGQLRELLSTISYKCQRCQNGRTLGFPTLKKCEIGVVDVRLYRVRA